MNHWQYLKQMQVGELAEFIFESACIITVGAAALIIVKYAVLGVLATNQ